MHDVRWFAPNQFCTLPVRRLRAGGLRIATEGDEPARMVFAADGVSAVEAYRYAWRHRVPIVAYLWDLPPWQLDGGRSNAIVPVGGRLIKIPRLSGAYPGRNGYFSRQRFVARHAVEVWVPSQHTQQDVRRHFGINAEEVPFCFDSDRFNRAAGWQKPADTAVVLSVSRLVPQKNHAAILRAAALLSPKPRVHLVGSGSEAGNLRVLARQLGLELQLDEEWQSDQQIVAVYLGASAVVSASRFEGMGLTPLEGVALGIPVVASDIPPHREFAGGHAVLVPLDDDAAMARAIENALKFDGMVSREPRDPIPELTIEACAARLLPRLEALLRRTT